MKDLKFSHHKKEKLLKKQFQSDLLTFVDNQQKGYLLGASEYIDWVFTMLLLAICFRIELILKGDKCNLSVVIDWKLEAIKPSNIHPVSK